ncbi:MAG: hypothetical protein J6T24_09925 [Clostridia bacterium]|nr:hypothetical protein [Clostridia bacterium]
MKKGLLIRAVIFLLTLTLLFPSLFACGDTPPADTTTAASTTAATTAKPEGPLVDRVDLTGVTIRILQNVELYRDVQEAGAYSPILFSKGPDEEEYDKYGTNAVFAEIYNRNNLIAEKTGVEVLYTPVTFERMWGEIVTQIEGYALSDLDDAPDIVSHIQGSVYQAGVRGLLYNAYEQDMGTNYFDFSHESWYTDMMKAYSWDDSKIYTLCGDYWMDILRCSTPVLVNISMYNDLYTLQGGIEDLYAMVETGYWTLDEMIGLTELAYSGPATGGVFNPDATFGLISNSYDFMHIVSDLGFEAIETDADGNYIWMSADTTLAVHNLIDDMILWQKSDAIQFNYDKSVKPETGCIHKFVDGGALFTVGNALASMEGALIQDSDNIFGVLPSPKLEADGIDSYRTSVGRGNAGGICINSSIFSACSAFLQMQTEGSTEVMRLYFEEGLQLKNNMDNSVGQVAMLNYVRDGLYATVAPGNMYGVVTPNDTFVARDNLIRKSVLEGTNTFSSDWSASTDARETALGELGESFGKAQE